MPKDLPENREREHEDEPIDPKQVSNDDDDRDEADDDDVEDEDLVEEIDLDDLDAMEGPDA